MLNKQKRMENIPRNRLDNALLTVIFLNANSKGIAAAEGHWMIEKSSKLNQLVDFKDV